MLMIMTRFLEKQSMYRKKTNVFKKMVIIVVVVIRKPWICWPNTVIPAKSLTTNSWILDPKLWMVLLSASILQNATWELANWQFLEPKYLQQYLVVGYRTPHVGWIWLTIIHSPWKQLLSYGRGWFPTIKFNQMNTSIRLPTSTDQVVVPTTYPLVMTHRKSELENDP